MSLDYLKGKKILLVDDEEDLLEMLLSILQDDGYRRIRTASTQKDALELCRTWKPELAVLDVRDFYMRTWRQIVYHKDKWVTREMDAFIRLARS